MKRVVLASIFIFVALFLLITQRMRTEPINCSTFNTQLPNGTIVQKFGCDILHDLGNGLTLKVVNLRHYVFLFNRYLWLDLVEVKNGTKKHHLYLAKTFEGVKGISLNIRPGKDISTDPKEQKLVMSINDFKKWLDNNNFQNKQVVAIFYTRPGEKKQYFVEMSVYQGDVEKN